MSKESRQEPINIWTPFYRSDLEALLSEQEYTELHLYLLYWLIWLSLLSQEELLRLLSIEEDGVILVKTKADLAEQIEAMKKLRLIDTIMLREPSIGRHPRYYVTDKGLYLYISTVHSSPPLSISRLVRSYPVERDDLTARLARPQLHLALSELVTRLIAEGEPLGYHLASYQQPWQHTYTFGGKRKTLKSDAALLIQQAQAAKYAFLVHVDTDHKADRQTEKFLHSLLDLRQTMLLYRQNWPSLLILSTQDRLPLWARLLLESSLKQITRPLSGGITTLDAIAQGVYTPIWYDLIALASAQDPKQVSRVPFSHLLRDPASPELSEQFSHQHHFFELLLKDAASPPPRTKQRLTRYVGDSLQYEATHITREQLEELFFAKRKNRLSTHGTGLLTLALTEQEKEILTWAAHHPLLDIHTIQALLRPMADVQAIKPLQQKITRLFKLGLIETRLWTPGKTPLEQQRYLLTSVALKFMSTRQGEPFSFYFMHPKYYKESDDEQTKRQWGTRGLAHQMSHTNALYTFMRQLYHQHNKGTQAQGEALLHWKSAHEAALWYRDTISQNTEHARPDAELVFLSSSDAQTTIILLEYDRGTTQEHEYYRKFKAYLDYQQATGITLPLLVVVTPSQKAAQKMQRVLNDLGGSLQIVILQERDVLAQGLIRALHPP
jgi:hypothetical protein